MIIEGENGWPVRSRHVGIVNDYDRRDRWHWQVVRVYQDECIIINKLKELIK